MNKTTLKKMSRKELINIAKEIGIEKPSSLTSPKLIEKILTVKQIDSNGKTLPPRKLSQEDENLEMKGGSKKFETQSDRTVSEPEYPSDETRELPQGYGDTKIVAMIRDPYWAFAYWEINHDKRQELSMMNHHNKKLYLRIYDTTGISFNGFNAHSSFDIEVNDFTNNWYIQLPEANRSYCVDLGTQSENGDFVLIARSNIIEAPRDTISDLEDQQWAGAGKENFEQVYSLSGGYKIKEWAGSEMISKMLSRNLEEQLSSGGLSSGAVASSSMRPTEEKIGEKDFWLVVNTELIVYGATEPNAKVTLQGRELQLRPDGTFSVRFALPDGEQIIPVHALNNDGDIEKQVTPVVRKETRIEIE